jgi:uncharacterized protein
MEPFELRFVEVKPLTAVKRVVIGLPDVGLVGLITVNHLITGLSADEVGYVESSTFPPVVVVHEGEPKFPMRFFHKEGVVYLTSEIPIPASSIPLLARGLVEWVKGKGSPLILSVSGVAVPNRLEIETPEVYGVASTPNAKRILIDAGVKPLEEGFMVGPHSQILMEAVQRKIDNLVLVAQSHYQYPDPGAAASAVSALNRILGLNVDVKTLLEQAEEIRLKMREVMHRTYRQMERMQKAQEQELPPMYV